MPKTVFTPQEINAYLKTTPQLPAYTNNSYNISWAELERFSAMPFDALHPYYTESLIMAECMKVHADGFFPYRLLKERRPNEQLEVLLYREKIWVAKSKPTFTKVFNSLQKIRRSSDWLIKYPENSSSEFPKIIPEESLETYCEKEFPYFTSVTNWVFGMMLRKYLIDPNALVFINPIAEDVPENGYIRPYPEIFDSINILDYVDDDFAVLMNPFGSTYYIKDKPIAGKTVFIVTTQDVLRYDQIDGKNNFKLTEYHHGLGILPAFKLGGTLINQTDNYFLYESRIAGMVPELDEAVREYSDLQAAKVLHLYPERWEYRNNDCVSCAGTGKRPNPLWTDGCNLEADVQCAVCQGTGYANQGPYSKMIVKPGDATTQQASIPNPPAGFIEKDAKIIELQEASVRSHLADALSAINFEFLINVPLSQSGVSKQYDRNESNNTSHAVAEDIVAAMDKLYKITASYRYLPLYSLDQIEDMLPDIPVPENYDLYSIADAQAELSSAKSAKTNPVILNAMEVDYATKRFGGEKDVRDELVLILTLDPLPNISEDDKMSRLSNKGITQQAYVVSSNIQEFVQRALEEEKDFVEKSTKDQKAIINKYADQLIASMQPAKVLSIAPADNNGLGNNDNAQNQTNVPAAGDVNNVIPNTGQVAGGANQAF